MGSLSSIDPGNIYTTIEVISNRINSKFHFLGLETQFNSLFCYWFDCRGVCCREIVQGHGRTLWRCKGRGALQDNFRWTHATCDFNRRKWDRKWLDSGVFSDSRACFCTSCMYLVGSSFFLNILIQSILVTKTSSLNSSSSLFVSVAVLIFVLLQSNALSVEFSW